MLDHRWIESMQDELNSFKQLDVWELVPLPEGRHAIKVWYVIGVATLRALVRAGDKTSEDVRSWYMISRDAKSWVLDCSAYIHCHIAQLSNCLRYWHNDWVLSQTYELTNIIVDVFEYHFQIMPPTMTIQSASRPAAASRGGGTGGRASSGGGRTRGRSGDQGDGRIDVQGSQLQNLLPTIVAKVGDQGRGQGNGRNQNGDAVNDNIWGDVSRGCTYKKFLAYNPKEYDGKGGAIVYTRWIEKMESVQDMSGCRDSKKLKYTTGLFFGKALTWWNSQIHTRGREATVGMSWEDFKILTREEFCPSNEMQ
ncbi:hypothetical protein Tco_0424443 [Tanacetum coccineum]